MPKPDGSLSAVVVSGGKQYRVTLGDRILVDRIAGEPGASVKLGRVLLFDDGKEIKVGNPAIDGVDVDAKVIAQDRGPRTESIRYKSKKRVRVHRGGRSYLTALEIIAIGGVRIEKEEKEESKATKPRGRAKAAPKKKAAPVKAEAAVEEKVEEPKAEAPRRTSRRSKKESE